MAVAILMEWADVDEGGYLELLGQLDLGGKMFPGAMLHVAGPSQGGWRVVDVWESQEAYDRFLSEMFQQAMDTTIGRPAVTTWPVHTIVTPQGPPAPQE